MDESLPYTVERKSIRTGSLEGMSYHWQVTWEPIFTTVGQTEKSSEKNYIWTEE